RRRPRPRPRPRPRAADARDRPTVDRAATTPGVAARSRPSGILRDVSEHLTSSATSAPDHVSAALVHAPVVAHVVRAGFVESIHHGTAVVTAPDGTVELEVGDASGPVFPRSSSKPLQALAMV